MGDQLRLRAPTGAGAEPGTRIKELEGSGASEVSPLAIQGKTLDEILAPRAAVDDSGGAGTFFGGAALQLDFECVSAGAAIFPIAGAGIGAQQSATGFAAVCGAAESAEETRVDAAGNADAV